MMTTAILSQRKQHGLAFIVSSSVNKLDPNTRQLVRSHVMRGKNRRQRAADLPRLKSWINQESIQNLQLNSATVPYLHSPLHGQVWSDLPFTQFAYDMPPYALDLVFKFFTVVGQTMYPIEVCLSSNPKDSIWAKYLAVDALYCHTTLWATQAYFDWVKGFKYSCVQMQHARKTLEMLQQRLTDSQLATSDGTICAVVCLVLMTALVGDHDAAKRHMMGLFKIVELRGGVRAFMENSQIQLKICRADLTMAMLTESKPLFFPDGISWGPYTKLQNNSHEFLPKHFAGIETKLSYIWADLREFTRSASLAFQTKQKMDGILFQEMLISIQYRLLLLDVSAGSPNNAIHVGILGFSTNIFLQTQALAVRFENLSVRLRACIFGLQGLENKSVAEFKLWLLFVARMLIGEEIEDSWLNPELRKTLNTLNLISWKSAREVLQGYLWISEMHDNDGKRVFQEALESHGLKP